MSFAVYILYSKILGRYYIGQTIDLSERINLHNQGYFSNSYTSNTSDWEVVFTIDCISREQAIAIEKHIKRMKSRKYIENLIKYPEISKRLVERYGGSLSR